MLYYTIKSRREIKRKYSDLMKDQLLFLTAIWNAQRNQPITSWTTLVQLMHDDLLNIIHNDGRFYEERMAAELAMAIMLCGVNVTTVCLLRDIGQDTESIVRLLRGNAHRIKSYHQVHQKSSRGSHWPDQSIYGVVLFLRDQRPLSAIADPCSDQEVIDGTRWLNGEQ